MDGNFKADLADLESVSFPFKNGIDAISFTPELAYATLRTTLRYVCFFGQKYSTELRYGIFCYVTELRIIEINATDCLSY